MILCHVHKKNSIISIDSTLLYDHNKSKVSHLLLRKSGYHITKYKTSAAGLFHAKFLLWSQPLLGEIWPGIGHAIPSMVVMD